MCMYVTIQLISCCVYIGGYCISIVTALHRYNLEIYFLSRRVHVNNNTTYTNEILVYLVFFCFSTPKKMLGIFLISANTNLWLVLIICKTYGYKSYFLKK